MRVVVSTIGIGMCLVSVVSAQDPAETQVEGTFERRIETRALAAHPIPAHMGVAGQAGTFHWIAAGPGMEGQVVKNAPYSAEGVTETTRTLADGTKISQKSRTKIYRDSEGRTRREQTLAAIGEWSAAGEPPTIISVSNPAAGETYMLNSKDKTAHKMKVHIEVRSSGDAKPLQAGPSDVLMVAPTAGMMVDRPPIPMAKDTVIAHRAIRAEMGAAGSNVMFFGGADDKKETLADRSIEGVTTKGTRITSTIPVGKIGNDRPINIVHESWYSPELQAVVLSETKDPMSGDITYRLTNIQRSNPPASLFEIPPDYKIEEGPTFTRKIEVRENKQ